MAWLNRIKLFPGAISKRLIVGGLLIHAILIPLLFYGIATIVKDGYEQQFIDHVRADARSFSDLLNRANSLEQIQASIDDAVFQGRILYAAVTPLSENGGDSFQEDFFFGQSDDNIYNIAIPIEIENREMQLRLGYDEEIIHEQIRTTYLNGLYLAIGYVLLSLLFGTIMGSQVTRPIRKLRDAAHDIFSGDVDKNLNVRTSVTEVGGLAHDLESMRQALVKKTDEITMREMYTRDVMNNVMDGIITVNELGVIETLNPAVERLFGYDNGELKGKSISLLFVDRSDVLESSAPEPSSDSKELSNHELSGGLKVCESPQEIWGRRSDNSKFPLEITSRRLSLDHFGHYIFVVRDITARKQADAEIRSLHQDLELRVQKRTEELAEANEELEYQAMHDALTNLPNRVLLHDRLDQAIGLAQRSKTALALLIFDLNNFKEINDTLGHHVGDVLLQQIAERLHASLRASDTIARVGGDEFALLLPTDVTEAHACQTAEKLIDAMADSFVLQGQRFRVGVSIGVALYPKHGTDSQTLMRHADVAMYVAKKDNSGYSVYDKSQDKHSLGRLELMGQLHNVIEQNELVLLYQPKFDLNHSRVSELEALIRWNHRERGLLLPDEFVGLAEHNGLIHPLTEWVINEAIRQCAQFRKAGLELTVAVNLSMHNLRDSSLPQQITSALNRYQLPPDNLALELTESAIMADPRHAIGILSHLDRMGVQIAIDDFGTGYSSLSYLKQLPVDEIKIDKSFVLDMADNPNDLVIVRSTIDLGHNMGRRVSAEGVESQETWDLLQEMGCDLIQGYHIAPPMHAEELVSWIAHYRPTV